MLLKVFGKAPGGETRPTGAPDSCPSAHQVGPCARQALFFQTPGKAPGVSQTCSQKHSCHGLRPGCLGPLWPQELMDKGRVAELGPQAPEAPCWSHGQTQQLTYNSGGCHQCCHLDTTHCHHSISRVKSAGVAGSHRCGRHRSPDSGVNQGAPDL